MSRIHHTVEGLRKLAVASRQLVEADVARDAPLSSNNWAHGTFTSI
jgi:hypothetical protein